MFDHPRVRQSGICPLCDGEKERGLVACWPCFRRSGLKYGAPDAERAIAAVECRLEQEQRT